MSVLPVPGKKQKKQEKSSLPLFLSIELMKIEEDLLFGIVIEIWGTKQKHHPVTKEKKE